MIRKILSLVKEIRKDSLKRSMLLSTLCRPAGMVISFIYTPVLLAYLGEESYGIWSTILSVINWINYFDVGIGQGLRNTLAGYIAKDDKKKAKQAVSTGYVTLTMISGITFIIGIFLILVVNVGAVFSTEINIRSALVVSFFCICINFILGLSKSQLYATQQAEKVSLMTVLIQFINLIGIFILSLFSKASLVGVAVVIGVSGIIVNLFYTGKMWNKFNFLKPGVKYFCKRELRNICNVGVKFFFIQIAALILYSTDNMIITRILGPAYVTPYHMVYTAFGIINGIFSAMIAPLWSRYTVAVEKKDYKWIKKTIISLDKFLPLIILVLVIGIFLFEPISKIWLQHELTYEPGLIVCMAIYHLFFVWASIYSSVLNGIGRINLQLILAVGTAILNVPLSIYLGKNCEMGTTGVCLATVICSAITDVCLTVDTHRYLNKMSQTS